MRDRFCSHCRHRASQLGRVVEHLTPDRLVYDPSVVDPSQPLSLIRPSIHSSRVRTPITSCKLLDRGHLAAAGNHRKSRNSIDQTFFLTNMSPQVGRGFNRDKWNDVEIHVR
uniref:Endonuclease n=1 Tax=Ditylenchus dipsaci TaxID=166011 RepID=A0A915ENQ1_9BILA